MDLNLVVLAGRLAAPAEIRQFESGARYVRVLVTVRSEPPKARVDVVPVTLWGDDDNEALLDALCTTAPGTRLWVAGQIQRRFWSGDEGRRSRIEIVARHIEAKHMDDDSDWDDEPRDPAWPSQPAATKPIEPFVNRERTEPWPGGIAG